MRLVPYVRRDVGSRLDPSRVFEEFLDGFFTPAADAPSTRNWIPAVDILEKEGDLVLRAELPGLEEKDIDLKLEGNILTLRGERKLENRDKKDNYHRVEAYYGSFSRSFTLPDSADRDKISAEYKNGILTIRVPQRPEVKPREIPVSVH